MTSIESTIDVQEVNKFAQLAKYWWDPDGPLKTLHDINDARLEFISHHVELSAHRVLDVGCGGGILCEAMSQSGGIVTGIDAADEAIQVAQGHAKTNKLAIDYVCKPIEDFESAHFDVVTCMEMLEHVQKPELVLEHCVRLLKPDGILFVSTISRTLKAYASAIIAAEYIMGILPKQTHDYNKFIKPSELTSIARSLGLKLIEMKGLKYNPISRQASLGSDVAVNYMLALKK